MEKKRETGLYKVILNGEETIAYYNSELSKWQDVVNPDEEPVEDHNLFITDTTTIQDQFENFQEFMETIPEDSRLILSELLLSEFKIILEENKLPASTADFISLLENEDFKIPGGLKQSLLDQLTKLLEVK